MFMNHKCRLPAVRCLGQLPILVFSLGGQCGSVWGQFPGGPTYNTPYAITTLAGTPPPTPGSSLDGTGSAAQFDRPGGVAVDATGNIYVSDSNDCIIRKITPAGAVTTFAGSAVVGIWGGGAANASEAGAPIGSADGTGPAAQFSFPAGLAFDASGNLYVADSWNNTIRKITPAAVVTTLAGTPAFIGGPADGTGPAAQFYRPVGLAVDASGNVYVADSLNDTIRKITPARVVTTLAGTPGVEGSSDGTGSAAQFNEPAGVAVDTTNNVYVADTWNNTIRKITSAGVVTTIAGTAGVSGSADGVGTAAQFSQPSGLSIDANGNLFVADTGNSTIREITPAGVVTTVAGNVGNLEAIGAYGDMADGVGTAAHFLRPGDVAVDANGNVYVADTYNNEIRKITPARVVTTMAGSFSATAGYLDGTGNAARFNQPQGISVDLSGNVYVADTFNETIRKITADGEVTALAGSPNNPTPEAANGTPGEPSGAPFDVDGTGAAATFNLPSALAVDKAGNVYVADGDIRKITPDGVVTTLAGSPGAAGVGSADGTGPAAQFDGPQGIAVDASGNIYVADNGNDTIRKVTPIGVVTTLAGTAGVRGSADGTGSAAQFFSPMGLAVDWSGNVYVADQANGTIRKIFPNGAVTTLAGSSGIDGVGNADGTGAAAQFRGPSGVAVDGGGNVYVADTGNNEIRMVTPAGVVTTLAGAGPPADSNNFSFADGTGAAAQFNWPASIAVDPVGNIYVADRFNNTIRYGVKTPLAGPSITIVNPLPSSSFMNGAYPIGLFVTATGNPASIQFQWFLNGVAIAGATGASYAFFPTAASEGTYSIVASNSVGSETANLGTFTVQTDAWLINLSARAYSASGAGGANQLIAGFVTAGPDAKSILIRGDGPSIANFGVTGFLTDPQLTIVSGGTTLATATSWSTTLEATFAKLGAFNLTVGSHDTALLESLAAGPYTAQVISTTNNSGVALAEIYDADGLAPADRLINLSARAFVGTGSDILIGGFVIKGSSWQTVIIRGDGPALTGFGVPGALASPVLTLFDGTGGIIATNTGWGTWPIVGSAATGNISVQPLTAELSAKVGAFALVDGSADSAIVATLPPGNYTAQVTGGLNSTGVALIEIYELR